MGVFRDRLSLPQVKSSAKLRHLISENYSLCSYSQDDEAINKRLHLARNYENEKIQRRLGYSGFDEGAEGSKRGKWRSMMCSAISLQGLVHGNLSKHTSNSKKNERIMIS